MLTGFDTVPDEVDALFGSAGGASGASIAISSKCVTLIPFGGRVIDPTVDATLSGCKRQLSSIK